MLDPSGGDGEDGAVLTAGHGAGEWQFVRVADSLQGFLRFLSRVDR